MALAGNPELLFFDEPTVGMDVTARRKFWETVQTLVQQGKTVIFTTHYLQEADDYADRILLINHGELVAEGTPAEIATKIMKQSVSFLATERFPIAEFRNLPYVSDIAIKKDRLYIYTDNVDQVLAKIYENRLSVKDIHIQKGRLEQAFEQLTIQ